MRFILASLALLASAVNAVPRQETPIAPKVMVISMVCSFSDFSKTQYANGSSLSLRDRFGWIDSHHPVWVTSQHKLFQLLASRCSSPLCTVHPTVIFAN